MPLFGKSKSQTSTTRQSKELEEAAKKLEQERIIEERNERLLPWNLEQKVAVVLNPVKVPFIIIAGLLGSIVELKIGIVAKQTWYRGIAGTGPECVVHLADYNDLTASTNDYEQLSTVTGMLDTLFSPVISMMNATAHAFSNCTTVNQSNRTSTQCDLLNGPLFNMTFDPDNCDILVDPFGEHPGGHAREGLCVVSEDLTPTEEVHDVGVQHRVPYVPYALIWMIFKLVWCPGYYVDRAAKLASGGESHPEPILKLISEPTCDKTGCCGKAGPFFSVLGMVSKCIRFSLLPNTLILPLTSMRFVRECQDKFIIYSKDVSAGFAIYIWLLFDLFSMIGLYVVAQTVLGGKAISQNWYRCYKCVSIGTTLTALSFFFFDLFCTFKFRFWQGLSILIQLAFTLDLSWDVTYDIAKTVANVVVFFDALQFTIMIMSILCPKLLARAPVPEWLQEWTAQPDDIKSTPSTSSSLGSVASRSTSETDGLLSTGASQAPQTPSPRPGAKATAKSKVKSFKGIFSR